MKAWVKGGLWGIGILAILGMLFMIVVIVKRGYVSGGEFTSFRYLLVITVYYFLIAAIPAFIIGVIIGLIIGKINSKKKEERINLMKVRGALK